MKSAREIKESELFASLNLDIKEMRLAESLYKEGKREGARKILADYVRENFECEKVLSCHGIDPKSEPDEDEFYQANAALEYNLVSVGIYHKFENGVDWYANPTPNKYEEWTWQFARHYQLVPTSRVYAYTKDERYAERIADLIDSFIKNAPAPPLDTDGHATLCWRTLDAGIRLLMWARVFALSIKSSSYSDEFIVEVFASIREHADRLIAKCTAANWLVTEMTGLYVIALLCPFIKESGEWKAFAKGKMLEEIENQTLSDGTHYELTFGYQSVSLHDFATVYKIGRLFGDEFPEEYPLLLKKYLYTFLKVMMPSGATPDTNDGSLLDVPGFIDSFRSLFPEDKVLAWAASGGKEGEKPDFESVLFPVAGLVAFRSSWEKDAVCGFFDGGKYGKCHNHEDLIRCHQHEDKLNFLMWVGEKNIVGEAQTYSYDTSKMRAYSRAPEGHNTVLVDGKGQNRFLTNHWDKTMNYTEEPIETRLGGEVEYASAVYDEGFGADGEKLATHKRTVYFIKNAPVGSPYFIIKDEIDAKDAEKLEVMWHYNTESLKITDFGAECDELKTYFVSSNGKSTLYCGSEEPFRGWRALCAKPPMYKESPVIHYTVKGDTRVVYTVFSPKDKHGEDGIGSLTLGEEGLTVRYKNGEELTV